MGKKWLHACCAPVLLGLVLGCGDDDAPNVDAGSSDSMVMAEGAMPDASDDAGAPDPDASRPNPADAEAAPLPLSLVSCSCSPVSVLTRKSWNVPPIMEVKTISGPFGDQSGDEL